MTGVGPKPRWWHVYRPRPIAGTLLVVGLLATLRAPIAGWVVLYAGLAVWVRDVRDIRRGAAL